MSTENQSPESLGPRQFSLAGMLSVVLACAVYLGVLRITAEYLSSFNGPDYGVVDRPPYGWVPLITVVVSWAALWAIYHYWELRPALRVHYAGPVVFLPLSLLLTPAIISNFFHTQHRSSLAIALFVISFGPFVSVLFGFPVVALMLVVRVLRREKRVETICQRKQS
jgi:hypothetical protein